MKTPKLISAMTAIFLFSLLFSTFLFAENPENIATKMVARLTKEIVLTESQQTDIQAKAKEFAVKLQNADSISDPKNKQTYINTAFKLYKQNVDSLLTTEQRQLLVSKRNERRNAVRNNLKSKKTTIL
jgi:hypothetical protein